MAHKHMNLKNVKKMKRFHKIRIICYFFVIYISFSYTFYYSLKNNKKVSNEEFINLMMAAGNGNVLNQYRMPNLVNSTMKFILGIDFTKPSTILNSSILKYGNIDSRLNGKRITLEYNDDYSDMEDLKNVSEYISDPNPKDTNAPIVYLYNSHQLENYSSDNLDLYGVTPNVMMASYVLREKLNEMGISSIVEDGNLSEILARNGWNYSYSYQASRSLMEEKRKQYRSLKYFIDIHRDSVGRNSTVAKIGNITYAKVLFVVGMDFNGWEANFQFAEKLNQMIYDKYPLLSRGIMKKTGMNVNGVYNQDISPNCILIEVGGVENKIDEVYQTMNVLADILSQYIKGDKS